MALISARILHSASAGSTSAARSGPISTASLRMSGRWRSTAICPRSLAPPKRRASACRDRVGRRSAKRSCPTETRDQASKSTRVPPTPEALRIPAAVLRPCSASAKLLGRALEALVKLPDDPAELLAPLDEEPVDELEALEEPDVAEVPVVGLVGSKVVFPTSKPMAAASVPLPTMAIVSASFLLVITI